MPEVLSLLLTAWLVVAVWMALLWLVHFPLKNAAIVDVGWSLGLPLVAWVYFLFTAGDNISAFVLAMMFTLWGGLLGVYLFKTRIWKQPEEGRYQELRRVWKTKLSLKFFFFFQFQALLDLWLSLPILLVCLNAQPNISLRVFHYGHAALWEYLGFFIWLIGWMGEILADFQLSRFKSNPQNKGEVCHVGLWRYSRHPNYFFEFLVWVGYATFALGSPWGWLAFLAPATILFLLFKITGIPATEEQSLRSRGDKYRKYQRTTSCFIPWFPKK